MTFLNDLKYALRSLARAKGVALTVVVTLALGIGANAAIFSVARGNNVDNTTFSVPEIQELQSGLKTLQSIGSFSQIGFTMVGLGEPRVIRAGVVDGNYFDVMGLHPVLGRLLNPKDDGPNASGAAVLIHRFWKTSLKGDPAVIGKTIRL